MFPIAAVMLCAQPAPIPRQAPRLSAGVKVEQLVATPDAPPFKPLDGAPRVRKAVLGIQTPPIS